MGVGKTTVCNKLNEELANSIFLDGDWCWNSKPFVVNEETKKMVMDNICYLLNNFIGSKQYQNIIFCWVMHEQTIIDEILNRVNTSDYEVKVISLVCDKEELEKRINKDIELGLRKKDVLKRSLARIDLYNKVNSLKVDVSNKTIEETVKEIQNL